MPCAASTTPLLSPLPLRQRGRLHSAPTIDDSRLPSIIRSFPAFDQLSILPGAGSQSGTGIVTLTAKVPAGGILVPLSSSNPSVASVPAYVLVAQGRSSASFSIMTTSVTATTSVTISASLIVTKSAALSVKVDAITSLVLQPSPAQVGDTVIGVVTLAVPAPAGGITITLTVDKPLLLSVDTSVFIAAGQTSGTFYAEALAAGSAKVTAHLNGVSTTTSLTISP